MIFNNNGSLTRATNEIIEFLFKEILKFLLIKSFKRLYRWAIPSLIKYKNMVIAWLFYSAIKTGVKMRLISPISILKIYINSIFA